MSPHLVVDGYNVIHAWPQLEALMRTRHAEDARRRLVALLAEYAAATGERVSVVFDAHARERGSGDSDVVDGVTVLWGSRGNSADHVIERLVSDASRGGRAIGLSVATDDRLQRELVMAMGASVLSTESLRLRLTSIGDGVSDHTATRRRSAQAARRLEHSLDESTRSALERMRRGLPPSRP